MTQLCTTYNMRFVGYPKNSYFRFRVLSEINPSKMDWTQNWTRFFFIFSPTFLMPYLMIFQSCSSAPCALVTSHWKMIKYDKIWRERNEIKTLIQLAHSALQLEKCAISKVHKRVFCNFKNGKKSIFAPEKKFKTT